MIPNGEETPVPAAPSRSAAIQDPARVAAFWQSARRVLGPALEWLWGFGIRHTERMPPGAVLVVANHVSYVDPLLVGYALPRPGAFMAKQELFRIPMVAAFIRRIGAFPVSRGAGDHGALDTAQGILDCGWPLIIYPEGTRNPTGRWGSKRLRSGAARLALARPVPIVPIATIGTERILPRGSWWPHRVNAEAVIGEPMMPDDYLPPAEWPEAERIRHVTRRIYEAVAGLLPEHLKAPLDEGPPPEAIPGGP